MVVTVGRRRIQPMHFEVGPWRAEKLLSLLDWRISCETAFVIHIAYYFLVQNLLQGTAVNLTSQIFVIGSNFELLRRSQNSLLFVRDTR